MRVLKNPYIVAAIFYLAIVLFVFWPILWPAPGTLVFGDDIHRSYHFFRQLFGDALARGEFPWWNPYLFSGEPLIANPSLAFWYPVNWLFALMPYRFVYSWIIPLHIFWAMLGMYILIRSVMTNDQLPISNGIKNSSILRPMSYVLHPIGPWIAGLVFGLSGFFMGRIWEGHIELILSASWMPWVVWANVKCQKSNVKWKTNCVIAGIVFAMQILAGYQTMAMMTVIAVGMVSVGQCINARSVKPFLYAGLSVIIGLGLSAIQILPGQEFFRASIRTYPLPYSWAVFGSYTIGNLKQLIDPFVLGFPWSYKGPSPNFGEMAAYMGKGGLLLALISIIAFVIHVLQMIIKRSNPVTKLFTHDRQVLVFGGAMVCIAIFGLWVSLGWNAPIDLNKILWDTVPIYKYLRIPSRHLILFVFGMSALAGIGLNYLKNLSFARPGLAKLAVFIISLFITVDMLWFAKNFVVLRPDPATRHNQELVSYLQKNLGMARILPNFNVGMGTRDALDFDAAMGYRLYSASGYDPAILRNYYEFGAAVAGVENPDVQQTDVQIPYLKPSSRYVDFLNVKYIFVPSWFDSVAGSSPKYKLVMEENKKDYFRLYENTTVLPRFFLASQIVGLPDRPSIARAIRAGEHDPGKVVLVQQKDVPSDVAFNCGSQPLPPVTVASYSMNKIILKTDTPCNAMLATSEVMYPGWQATIDGKPAKLIEGNLAFRTVVIPKGKHTMVMVYRPTVFIMGIFVSLMTLLGCLIWMKKRV
ncbi:MAG: YfhO family protein [Candidatus Gottesmanbacteria bacterium]|nr:YfhO family protein [Candidatus Gottesmanbacteria bacterium]